MSDRGVIKSEVFFHQKILFEGLRWGTITPTDIDLAIDFKNRLFIYVEFKHMTDTTVNIGQQLILERMCDNSEAPSYAMIAVHDTDIGSDVIAWKAEIIKCYYRHNWKDIDNPVTLLDAILKLRNKYGFDEEN